MSNEVPRNWQNELTENGRVKVNKKLEDNRQRFIARKLEDEYKDTWEKVQTAKEAISHLVGEYNKRQ
jgi:hypothetical protein